MMRVQYWFRKSLRFCWIINSALLFLLMVCVFCVCFLVCGQCYCQFQQAVYVHVFVLAASECCLNVWLCVVCCVCVCVCFKVSFVCVVLFFFSFALHYHITLKKINRGYTIICALMIRSTQSKEMLLSRWEAEKHCLDLSMSISECFFPLNSWL